MSKKQLTPLIQKAAHAYFARDADEGILCYLSSANHRRIIDAVHDTYRRIEADAERELINAVYATKAPDFAKRVFEAAWACRFTTNDAWDAVRRFTRNVEARILSGGEGLSGRRTSDERM